MIPLRRHAILVFAVLAVTFPPTAFAHNEADNPATSCAAEVGRTPNALPDEDARSLVFDDSTLFTVHRMPSYDRLPESTARDHPPETLTTPREAPPQRTPPRC
jgi:hypothetical protein